MVALLVAIWLTVSVVAAASFGARAPEGHVAGFVEALSVALPLYLTAGTSVGLLIQLARGGSLAGLVILWVTAIIGLAWSIRISGWQLAVKLLLFVWVFSLGLLPD